jgi:hypothetical protein
MAMVDDMVSHKSGTTSTADESEWRAVLLQRATTSPHNTSHYQQFNAHDTLPLENLNNVDEYLVQFSLLLLRFSAKLCYRRLIKAFYNWSSLQSTNIRRTTRQHDNYQLLQIKTPSDISRLTKIANVFVSDRAALDEHHDVIHNAVNSLCTRFTRYHSRLVEFSAFRKWKVNVALKIRIETIPIGLCLMLAAKHVSSKFASVSLRKHLLNACAGHRKNCGKYSPSILILHWLIQL